MASLEGLTLILFLLHRMTHEYLNYSNAETGESVLVGGSVSHSGCNKLSQTYCLKTAHIYVLLQSGVQKSTVKLPAGLRSFWRLRGKSGALSFPASRSHLPSLARGSFLASL